MLKKSITYEDFNEDVVTEDHYFHLSKADLVEMELSQKGGLHEHLQQIVASEDGKAIVEQLKELILSSYGKRSDDGKRFIKTSELREDFQSSEAYSALFMELCTDPDAAAEFVNGIVPASLAQDVAKMSRPHPSDPAAKPADDAADLPSVPAAPDAKVLSLSELVEMDGAELKRGLAEGRFKLAR